MVSQIKVNEIIKQSGSSISIGESGDTINLAGSTYAAAGDNTPAFFAYASSNTNLASDTNTKIALNSEYYDTDDAFTILMLINAFTCHVSRDGSILKLSEQELLQIINQRYKV